MRIEVYYPDRCQNCGKSVPLKEAKYGRADIPGGHRIFYVCPYIVTEPEAGVDPPGNVYYLGSDDEQHWLTSEMTLEFLERVFLACAHAVENENCRVKPTEQDACQSAVWEMDSEEESI